MRRACVCIHFAVLCGRPASLFSGSDDSCTCDVYWRLLATTAFDLRNERYNRVLRLPALLPARWRRSYFVRRRFNDDNVFGGSVNRMPPSQYRVVLRSALPVNTFVAYCIYLTRGAWRAAASPTATTAAWAAQRLGAGDICGNAHRGVHRRAVALGAGRGLLIPSLAFAAAFNTHIACWRIPYFFSLLFRRLPV